VPNGERLTDAPLWAVRVSPRHGGRRQGGRRQGGRRQGGRRTLTSPNVTIAGNARWLGGGSVHHPHETENTVSEPSDADLRAALVALVRRAGGAVEIANSELYDAMLTNHGISRGQFTVDATDRGIRLSLSPHGAT
jgi:hypothetical protein